MYVANITFILFTGVAKTSHLLFEYLLVYVGTIQKVKVIKNKPFWSNSVSFKASVTAMN